MSATLFVVILILHIIVGIIIPGIYLITKGRWKIKERVNFIASRMLFSWAIFFLLVDIYLITNYVYGLELASIVVLCIGIVPIMILAIASFVSAIFLLRKAT